MVLTVESFFMGRLSSALKLLQLPTGYSPILAAEDADSGNTRTPTKMPDKLRSKNFPFYNINFLTTVALDF
jgi:hypothetical protein